MVQKVTGAVLVSIAALAMGCGNGSNGKPANGPEGTNGEKNGGTGPTASMQVEEGTSACVSELLGVRYEIEDILKEAGLKVIGDCMFADIEIQELGESGAYTLKYRKIGEKWHECSSKEAERSGFVTECASAIVKTGAGEGEGEEE